MKVKKEYRKNELSKIANPNTIIVYTIQGRKLEYTNIHNPTAYINAMNKKDIVKIYVNNEVVWPKNT